MELLVTLYLISVYPYHTISEFLNECNERIYVKECSKCKNKNAAALNNKNEREGVSGCGGQQRIITLHHVLIIVTFGKHKLYFRRSNVLFKYRTFFVLTVYGRKTFLKRPSNKFM